MNTATLPNLGMTPEIEPRIKAALAAVGLTASEAAALFWESVARNGRATLDLIAPKAVQQSAQSFRDKEADELTNEDGGEMLQAAQRGEPQPQEGIGTRLAALRAKYADLGDFEIPVHRMDDAIRPVDFDA